MELRERSNERRCPLCLASLAGASRACATCGTAYHAACLSELGGCTNPNCQGAKETVPVDLPTEAGVPSASEEPFDWQSWARPQPKATPGAPFPWGEFLSDLGVFVFAALIVAGFVAYLR